MASKALKRRYDDDEAAHSGDETSAGEEEIFSEEDDSIVCGDDEVEYESGKESTESFHHSQVTLKELKKNRKRLEEARSKKPGENTRQIQDALQQNAKAKEKKQKIEHSKPALVWNSTVLASPDMEDVNAESEVKESQKAQESLKNTEKPDVKPKLYSNKILAESCIPPKPSDFGKPKIKANVTRKFAFRLFFTNSSMFQKFLLPIANAVSELRFNLSSTPEFTGIRMEAHDTYLTLANKSRYECGLEGGFNAKGLPITSEELTGLTFTVSASSFMQTLGCAMVKDTVLSITQYCDSPDKVSFECCTNENDVQTLYACDLLAESRLESLTGMQFNLDYHVNLDLHTLKQQTVNAKRCGANSIYFALDQAIDKNDDSIVHSKLSVGFKGTNTTGNHEFFQSARKIETQDASGNTTTEWKALPGLNSLQRQSLDMKRASYNEYDNSKLRLFLNHMVSFIAVLLTIFLLNLTSISFFPSHFFSFLGYD